MQLPGIVRCDLGFQSFPNIFMLILKLNFDIDNFAINWKLLLLVFDWSFGEAIWCLMKKYIMKLSAWCLGKTMHHAASQEILSSNISVPPSSEWRIADYSCYVYSIVSIVCIAMCVGQSTGWHTALIKSVEFLAGRAAFHPVLAVSWRKYK